MEIDPARQLSALLAAFLCGVAMAVLWEALAAVRILLGAYRPPLSMQARYEKKLPLLGRSVPFARRAPLGKLWQGIVIALFDLLFCLAFAVAVILLLFAYFDGAMRLSVPVLALLGYGLCHLAARTLLSPAVAYFAYGFAAGILYLGALLRLPVRGLAALVKLLLLRPLRALLGRLALRQARRYSKKICAAQLILADQGLSPSAVQKKGRMHYVKKGGRKNHRVAVGDPHPDPGHPGGGRGDRRAQHHGGQSESP